MATKSEIKSDSIRASLEAAVALDLQELLNEPILKKVFSLIEDLEHEKWSSEDTGDYSVWYPQYAKALTSVAANILEGIGYASEQQLVRFLSYAYGSALECIAHSRFSGMPWLIDATIEMVEACRTFISSKLSARPLA